MSSPIFLYHSYAHRHGPDQLVLPHYTIKLFCRLIWAFAIHLCLEEIWMPLFIAAARKKSGKEKSSEVFIKETINHGINGTI